MNAADQKLNTPPRTIPTRSSSWQILVVDDSLSVLNVVAAILRREPHLVLTLEQSPFRALELLQAQPHAFDLLMTDYRMPGMNGTALAQKVKSLRSDLPILAITTTPDAVRNNGDFNEIIAKPFTPRDLIEPIAHHCRHSPAATEHLSDKYSSPRPSTIQLKSAGTLSPASSI